MALSVLIVDDEELIRYGLREWLQEEGYFVMEAQDGSTALEQANLNLRVSCQSQCDSHAGRPATNNADVCANRAVSWDFAPVNDHW